MTNDTRLQLGLGSKLMGWLKKVGNYLHLSQLGSGHSESLEFAFTNTHFLPPSTKFENEWWIRKTKFDRYLCGNQEARNPIEQEMLECADGYAHRVCTGNLSQLRNFLEVSMRKSERPEAYAKIFVEGMLNGKGRDDFSAKLKRVFGKSLGNGRCELLDGPLTLDGLIKVMLGFTRKRALLVSEWADDQRVWSPAGIVTS